MEMLIGKAGFGHTKKKVWNSTKSRKQSPLAILSGQESFLVDLFQLM